VSTYAQNNSIRESLERLQPDVHSCLMIYEAPKGQLAPVPCAPGEVFDRKQIDENDRQVKNYTDVAVHNRKQVPPQVLLNLIRSHTMVIWDGMVCENLHGGLPEERLAPDPTAEEVGRVLANLRDRQRIKDGLSKQCRNAAIPPVESILSGSPADSSPSGCGTCLSQILTLQEQVLNSEKMEALGRMATGLVHELEHRIATILLCTEPLIGRLPPDDSRLNLAKQIFTAARSATTLTKQLLAFGRPARIRPELLDLNTAVAELEEVLRCELDQQSELRFVPAPVPCPVNIDRGQLEQVLLNLILNARDAMSQGGIITIRTAQTFKNAEGPVRLGSRAEPVVTLSVTDTGRGMAANIQKRAFDPFFTTKGPGQGAGLGLSIVYGIVQKQFGGTISVESLPGMGTTVTVYLPRAEMRVTAAAHVVTA
jgi:signal transduction histidine kinase